MNERTMTGWLTAEIIAMALTLSCLAMRPEGWDLNYHSLPATRVLPPPSPTMASLESKIKELMDMVNHICFCVF